MVASKFLKIPKILTPLSVVGSYRIALDAIYNITRFGKKQSVINDRF